MSLISLSTTRITGSLANIFVSSGIAASNIFRQQDAPRYIPAMIAVIATQVLSILHVLKNFYVYSRQNRKADRGEGVIEGQEGFRYTL